MVGWNVYEDVENKTMGVSIRCGCRVVCCEGSDWMGWRKDDAPVFNQTCFWESFISLEIGYGKTTVWLGM